MIKELIKTKAEFDELTNRHTDMYFFKKPTQYPCLVVFNAQGGDFVYLEDFGLPASIKTQGLKPFPPNSSPLRHDFYRIWEHIWAQTWV